MVSWLHDAFHSPRTTIHTRVNMAVWALIVLSMLPLAWDVTGHDIPALLEAFDDVVLALFVVEYVLRVATFHPPALRFYELTPLGRVRAHIVGRLRFMLRPLLLVDLLTILGSVPLLRGLRALRLLRLLRSNRVLRYANPFEGIARALEENALLFAFGLTVFFTSTVLGGLSFFLTERRTNDAIATLPDAMWWSIVTLTTVGYGDLTPSTGLGRIVAGCLMVVGMVTLALFAGIVGTTLMSSVASMREEQFRMSQHIGHILICGYEPGARMLLDTLEDELDLDTKEVVVFAPGERPPDVPPSFRWLSGDPTKESELDKARVVHADAVIIVGSRSDLPQQADARTILTAFTIRRYLKRSAATKERKTPLYIVAEILDAENVDHARTAGADEVIETTRIGFSMLAHAVEMPGTATILGELADVRGHSLFVGRIPAELREGHTFGEVARSLKDAHGIVVLGLRFQGQDRLAPPDGEPITGDHRVVYLGRSAVLASDA
jgi:voltage-gated potassium channel